MSLLSELAAMVDECDWLATRPPLPQDNGDGTCTVKISLPKSFKREDKPEENTFHLCFPNYKASK